MIDGVYDRFLDGRVRVVPEAVGLGPLRALYHGFLKVAALDVLQGAAGHPGKGAFKYLFLETVAAGSVGEPDHVNLRRREKRAGIIVKEHKSDILRESGFGRAAHDVHPAPEGFHRDPVGLLRETAAHLGQEFPGQFR